MSSSPTAKAAKKEHKDNKEDNFSPFLGSVEWKEEWATQKDQKLSGWMSYPISLMELSLVWKKELPSHPYLKQKLIYGKFRKSLLLQAALPCRQI